MMRPECLADVIKSNLCISCGACAGADCGQGLGLVMRERHGVYHPHGSSDVLRARESSAFYVCPGKGYDIERNGEELYPTAANKHWALGRYRVALAARSRNAVILKNASSGGIMTEIAAFLLEEKRIDGVTVNVFRYGAPGPRTEPRIARSLQELIEAQGSKYCPTYTNVLMEKCLREGGRYLFLGTPCQIGALRLAQELNPDLKNVFPFTMTNFCGGYRNFRELDSLIRRNGGIPSEVDFFRFRGGGQPGSMMFRQKGGQTGSESYPEYNRRAVAAKERRCTFCVDAVGELADFSCGDAWLPRFGSKGDGPWSILIGRSDLAEVIIQQLIRTNRLVAQQVTADEIAQSQWTNLNSKKMRQGARMRLCMRLGLMVPAWDCELPIEKWALRNELRIIISKKWSRYKRILRLGSSYIVKYFANRPKRN